VIGVAFRAVGLGIGLSVLGATAEPAAGPIPRPSAQGATREAEYWCSMHPDVRSATPGACPICHMPLVPIPPASFAANPVDLRVTPIVGGVRVRLAVKNPGTGATVRRFDTVHDRPMHLFVVGDGLNYFVHDHPVQQADGVFMLDVPLPRPGPYMAIAEFLPTGGTPQTFQQLFTTGDPFTRPPTIPEDAAPKTQDGLRVSVNASALKSGGAGTLAFEIADAASAAPIADLEPYLGASAHLLIVPVDLTEAIHAHPAEGGHGPVLSFTPTLPRPGRYKMWLQVQRAGRVTTAAFVVDVP
jgi:heavy metal-binding protein